MASSHSTSSSVTSATSKSTASFRSGRKSTSSFVPKPPRSASKSAAVSPGNERKRQAVLNKFLTKTYHLIEQCDPSIASWSHDGDSFTIKDVDAFEKHVLPQYFNHSKFSSFTRQLNFYGFQKIRLDADLQRNNSSVRFYHENFRRGKPELLQNINRTTAKTTIQSSTSQDHVETLRQEVAQLHELIRNLTASMDERVEAVATAIKNDYVVRIQRMEAAYAELYATVVLGATPIALPSSTILTVPHQPHQQLHQSSKPNELQDISQFIRTTKAQPANR